MSEILEFPFDSGAYEAADRKWLPPNLLAVAENVRLDRDGRLVVRPGETALNDATMSSEDMVPFDLANYQGRLVALGTQLTSVRDRATDLFEYIAGKDKWRATSGADTDTSTGVRLPQLTDIREVGLLPDQGDDARHVSLACGQGYVCAVIARAAESTIHVFDPTTNQTLLLSDVPLRLTRVVYAGTDFWIYGVDADEDIVRYNFDPGSDETLSGASTLLSNATTVDDLAASTFGTGSAVAWCTASSAEIRTYSSSGASVTNWQGVAAHTDAVALVGNSAGTLLTLAYQDSSKEYFASTFNAAGVLQSGPTSLFSGGGGSGTRLGAGMGADGSTVFIVGVNEASVQGLYQGLAQSGHAASGADVYHDARPAMAPIAVTGVEFAGWQDLTASNSTLGTFHVTGANRMPQCFLAHQLCRVQSTSSNVVCTPAAAGSKLYIPVVQLAENAGNGFNFRFSVYEAETAATARRQMAEVGGELLIAGGLPLSYDGRALAEIGFAECPVVGFSAEGGTTGNLTLLATYQVKAVWKAYNGRTLVARSQPSVPAAYTLTGSNDFIDWTVTTPHSLRRHRAFRDQNLTVVVELYRTVGNGANFQLDVAQAIDPADLEAEQVTIRSEQADSILDDNAVIYSDESGMEIAGPYPCRYIWRGRDRALTGALPQEDSWFYSDLLIPGRQVSFPSLFFQGSYIRRANQPITAVGAFETVGVVWTVDEIAQIPGRGPERSGTGEFDSMVSVATPGGCIDWRSVVSAPPGFFFQMAPDKLMLLTRGPQGGGAGEVVWAGQAVRDTLASFPVITGAVHIRKQMAVAFSCNTTDGTDGRILVYDLRRQQWFVDDPGGPVTALAELDGRLVWLSAGTVYQAHESAGTGTFVPHAVQTGVLRITKALGWGHIYRVGLLGAVLGACSVEAFIDYDDGGGLRSLGTETFTGTEGTFERFWSLQIQKTARFSLRFVVTGSSGSAGLRLNAWAAEVEGSKNMVRIGSTGQVA